MRTILTSLFGRPSNSAPAIQATREALAALKARPEAPLNAAQVNSGAPVAPRLHAALDFTLVAAAIGQTDQSATTSGIAPAQTPAEQPAAEARPLPPQPEALGLIAAAPTEPLNDLAATVMQGVEPTEQKPKRARKKAGLSSSSWKLPSPIIADAGDNENHADLTPIAFESGGASVLLDKEGQPCG